MTTQFQQFLQRITEFKHLCLMGKMFQSIHLRNNSVLLDLRNTYASIQP